MTQRRMVKGPNTGVIWLFIVLSLLLVTVVAVIVYVVAPTQQFERQVQATRMAEEAAVTQEAQRAAVTVAAQQAAAALAAQHDLATATAQAAVVEQHYAAGLTFAQAGDWPAAADAFRQTIALDAAYKDAPAQLQQALARVAATQATATAAAVALAAQRQGDAQATVAAATTATAEAVAALYARGQGLMNLERWADAEAALQAVFDVDPAYAEVQTLLASVAAETAKLPPTATPLPAAPSDLPTLAQPNAPTKMPTDAPTNTPTNMPLPPPIHTPTSSEPTVGAVRTIADVSIVYVPAGEFLMGSTDAQVEVARAACIASGYWWCDDSTRYEHEQPQHTVYLDAYWIGRTEVTNMQYQVFVDAGGYTTEYFWSSEGWEWRNSSDRTEPGCLDDSDLNAPDQPVVCVSWYEAEAYANWLAEVTSAPVRLPTEAEWEKAARGTDSRMFPWGDDFDGTRLNYCDFNCTADWRDVRFDDGVGDRSAPVGSYPAGASPYGALDMAGNVWEWTADW